MTHPVSRADSTQAREQAARVGSTKPLGVLWSSRGRAWLSKQQTPWGEASTGQQRALRGKEHQVGDCVLRGQILLSRPKQAPTDVPRAWGRSWQLGLAHTAEPTTTWVWSEGGKMPPGPCEQRLAERAPGCPIPRCPSEHSPEPQGQGISLGDMLVCHLISLLGVMVQQDAVAPTDCRPSPDSRKTE